MKVVLIDNFWRESYCYPDKLYKDNLTKEQAKKIADEYNNGCSANSDYYAEVFEDSYELQTYEI